MKTAILILFVLAVLVTAYWFLLRPILRRWAMLAPLWARLDAREEGFFAKLSDLFRGLKTKLSAAFVALSGLAMGLHDQLLPFVTGVDWTPIAQMVPTWAWPLILIGIGWLFSYLRTITFGAPSKE